MKKYIRGTIQSFAKEDVMKNVPAAVLEEIKKADPNPEFRTYVIGHEGTAHAMELGFAGKVKKAFRYVTDMVRSLAVKIESRLPIFNRHINVNTSAGREQIGEVVNTTLQNIGERLSALATMYIYPKFRELPLDIASIEAEIEYVDGGNGSADVIDIRKVTGIALGDSRTDSPAFPGATLLGVVQAFSPKAKEEEMTKEEIIAAIKELGLKITDVFSADDIVSSEPAKKAKQTEYEHAKRIEKKLGEERDRVIELTKELDVVNGKVKTLNEQVSQSRVKGLYDTALPNRKFDDREKAFIEKRIGTFKSDKDGEELKAEFDKFLDKQMDDYIEHAKLFGIEIKKGEDGKDKAGDPPQDGKGDGKDLTDPKNNDFIPE